MDSRPVETRDLTALARERVRIGPTADWIDAAYYDQHFNPKIRGQITDLLIETQIHAELRETFHRTAMRLESQVAVQQWSQWRLQFEPKTESLVIHSIKIRRGEQETEHASLERIQFLQRESALEGFIIHGGITLLLLLEDVCPGDILECSYTVTRKPRLMPEFINHFFTLPAGVEIGKYHFLVRHAEHRQLKWKSFSPKLEPKIFTEDGQVRCHWLDSNFSSPPPEECTPPGHLMAPWIQISDCPNWQTVARAIAGAWEEVPPAEGIAPLVEEIFKSNPAPLARINRAVELVQDQYRYLSVNLESGGQIPAAPATVVRRRYGDCKDLSFLLVQLLRALGVSARPIWVNSGLRQSLSDMLPSLLFDHSIVEFEFENEKRWIDPTLKSQGGGALKRSISNFGVGLPIDANSTELVPVPKTSLATGTYELKESFILDTTGKASYYATVITATGRHADTLRFEFANCAIDSLAKNRAQDCANRFTEALRIGNLQFRDNRELNEFVVAEAFEVRTALAKDKANNSYVFQVQSGPTGGTLAKPSLAERRNPFALPFPCHHTHIIEIECAGLNDLSIPLYQRGTQYFSYSRRTQSWPKLLKFTFSLETLANSIPVEKVPEHRKHVEDIWQANSFLLRLPSGYARSRKRSDFGALPRQTSTPASPTTFGASSAAIPIGAELNKNAPPGKVEETSLTASAASAKPMPPATDGSRFQIAPEKSRTTQRQSRGQKVEKRCMRSFFLFVGSFVALVSAHLLSRSPGTKLLAGTIVLLIVPFLTWSLTLAVIGIRECSQNPGRYADSMVYAILSLVCGSIFAVFMTFALTYGIRHAREYEHEPSRISQMQNINTEPLDFRAFGFMLNPPPPPWRQVDATRFGRNVLAAFINPDQLVFTVTSDRIPLLLADPVKHSADLAKVDMHRNASSFTYVKEETAEFNGLSGWQMNIQASIQGHNYYFVEWATATNGFGYELAIWGPASAESEVKDQAAKRCASFQLIDSTKNYP